MFSSHQKKTQNNGLICHYTETIYCHGFVARDGEDRNAQIRVRAVLKKKSLKKNKNVVVPFIIHLISSSEHSVYL